MRTPPRVLILVQNLPVPLDRRVWMECQTLVAAGYGVSVVCPKGPGDPAYALVDGVHLHKYAPAPATRGPLSFVWEFVYCWVRTAALVLRVARREGFDVIQACNPPDTFFALAAPFKLAGKAFVFDQHDLCPEVYCSRFPRPSRFLLAALHLLERATYRTADHVIATNESFRAIARERGRLRADDVSVVRSGPRAEHMRRGEPRPELRHGRDHLAVYLGIMGPQDGVDLALHAVAELVHGAGRADVHTAFLGFGDCFDDLVDLSERLEITEHVSFPGRADDDMIRDYLSTADLGLSPDPKNTMNDLCTMCKTLEYMAFELPVVAFDLRETRHSAGDAAVYAPANDVAAFARCVAELLDDPDRRTHMGKIGRDRITTELSWEHSAAAYLRVYQTVLGRRP